MNELDLYDIAGSLTEEERMVQDSVGRLVDEKVLPIIQKCFEEHRFPKELIPELAALGLLGSSIKGYDCAVRGAIGVDHKRVVGGAPCWRCNRAHETPCGNLACDQRQRCQCDTQTLHRCGKLEVYVLEFDMTGRPQVGRACLPKPVRPGCARTGGMQQGVMS